MASSLSTPKVLYHIAQGWSPEVFRRRPTLGTEPHDIRRPSRKITTKAATGRGRITPRLHRVLGTLANCGNCMPRVVSVSARCRLVGCQMARPTRCDTRVAPGINAGPNTAARGAPVNRGRVWQRTGVAHARSSSTTALDRVPRGSRDLYTEGVVSIAQGWLPRSSGGSLPWESVNREILPQRGCVTHARLQPHMWRSSYSISCRSSKDRNSVLKSNFR